MSVKRTFEVGGRNLANGGRFGPPPSLMALLLTPRTQIARRNAGVAILAIILYSRDI